MIDGLSMTETSIKVSSVGIRFKLRQEKQIKLRRDGVKNLRSLLFQRKKKEFWALKDINFETERGEIFGIIGGNGAGKSTLLKIIARIYPATEGQIQVNGNIAPLIELGAAFNPELTGTENIYLTGSIYKIPRRIIRQNFDRIIDFAGIRKFKDTPLKNYSSGMFIRLAFSIVIFFNPDIALIDEVFFVGDEVFQKKSFEKIYLKAPVQVVLGNSGITADTSALRGLTEKHKETDPDLYWERLKKITQQVYDVKSALESGDYARVGKVLTDNHNILIDMGLSHEKLITLCDLALREGALGAKLTGGGMGGYMVALTPGVSLQERVASAIEKEGFAVIRATIGEKG